MKMRILRCFLKRRNVQVFKQLKFEVFLNQPSIIVMVKFSGKKKILSGDDANASQSHCFLSQSYNSLKER